MSVGVTETIEDDRQRLAEEMATDVGPGWADRYHPGTAGCHELLDRASLAVDFVDRNVLSHPACVASPEWYALAERALAALHDLYRQVGATHLDAPPAE